MSDSDSEQEAAPRQRAPNRFRFKKFAERVNDVSGWWAPEGHARRLPCTGGWLQSLPMLCQLLH